MPGRRDRAILRGMNADIVIFFALQLAAVLGIVLTVVTVVAFGSPGVDADTDAAAAAA